MSKGLILFIAVIYAVIAGNLFYKGNIGLGIAFSGYAFSNIGLAMCSGV